MNLNHTPKPKERFSPAKHISNLWNARHRMVTLMIVLMSALVLNCCCIIIPLWDTSGGR